MIAPLVDFRMHLVSLIVSHALQVVFKVRTVQRHVKLAQLAISALKAPFNPVSALTVYALRPISLRKQFTVLKGMALQSL